MDGIKRWFLSHAKACLPSLFHKLVNGNDDMAKSHDLLVMLG